jgi:chloride channel 2
LAFLGISTAAVSVIIDYLIVNLNHGRVKFSSLTPYFATNYLLFILYSLVFAILSAACVHLISPHSVGSGIPEMRSILSGVIMNRFLSLRCGIAKALGLIMAYGAALSVGKEGPLVHIASCTAYQVMRLPLFKKLRKSDFMRNNMLAAACAAGMAATFGAPFGGVLFSIEVTATYYPIGNLWRSVFTTLFGSLLFYLLNNPVNTNFPPLPYDPYEYTLFILLGVICGVLGAFFNHLVMVIVKLRSRPYLRDWRYLLVGIVAITTATLAFPMDPLLKQPHTDVVNLLFSTNSLPTNRPLLSLTIFVLSKFLLTAITVVLPISCGLFTPVYAVGAGIGRLMGECVYLFFDGTVKPGGYAVVGAASLASGCTRTLSTAVILFELTGQLNYMVPVMIATVVATAVGNLFNLSIYDTFMKLRGLPYLSTIKPTAKTYNKKAQDVMRKDVHYIANDFSLKLISKILRSTTHLTYPVVNDSNSMVLIGSVSRGHIELVVEEYERMAKEGADDVTQISESIQPQFVFDRNLFLKIDSQERHRIVLVDPAPFQISNLTPLTKVYFLFSMLGLSHAWVTKGGKIVGVITKKDLIRNF